MSIDEIIGIFILGVFITLFLYGLNKKRNQTRLTTNDKNKTEEEIIVAMKLQGSLDPDKFADELINIIKNRWWEWKVEVSSGTTIEGKYKSTEVVIIKHEVGVTIEAYLTEREGLHASIHNPIIVWVNREDSKKIAEAVNDVSKNRTILALNKIDKK